MIYISYVNKSLGEITKFVNKITHDSIPILKRFS